MKLKEKRFPITEKEQMPFFSTCSRFKTNDQIFDKNNALLFLHLREKVTISS